MKRAVKKLDVRYFKSLCRDYNIAAFILFGSCASKRVNAMSDLDLAYLPRRPISQKRADELFLKITRHLKRDDIDLVNISETDLTLQFSAITTGKVIACANPKILYDFIVGVRRNYMDTANIRSIYAHYLTKRVKLGLFGEV